MQSSNRDCDTLKKKLYLSGQQNTTYALDNLIGSGTQGQVYSLTGEHANDWVVKVVDQKNQNTLIHEANALEKAGASQVAHHSVPTILHLLDRGIVSHLGRTIGYGVVIEKVKTFDALYPDTPFEKFAHRISSQELHDVIEEAAHVGADIYERTRELHDKGIHHNDNHKGNIGKNRSGKFVLFDYGFADYEENSRTVVPEKLGKSDELSPILHTMVVVIKRKKGLDLACSSSDPSQRLRINANYDGTVRLSRALDFDLKGGFFRHKREVAFQLFKSWLNGLASQGSLSLSF